jgi:hypothetical protein
MQAKPSSKRHRALPATTVPAVCVTTTTNTPADVSQAQLLVQGLSYQRPNQLHRLSESSIQYQITHQTMVNHQPAQARHLQC